MIRDFFPALTLPGAGRWALTPAAPDPFYQERWGY